MPGYKKHLTVGLVTGIVLLLITGFYYTTSGILCGRWLIFSLLGSLFPDVDTKSKGQLLFYRLALGISLILILTRQWISSSLLGFCALLPLVVHHRGLFHRAWFIIGLAIGVGLLCCRWAPQERFRSGVDALFFMIGALSHVVLDMGWRRTFRF